MGFILQLKHGARRISAALGAGVLAACLAAPASAQNIMINEVNRNVSNLTSAEASDEWVEIVLAEPLTAAQLNQYVVGDSQGSRTSKVGGFQFTGMEGIASNFPAGTIIVIAGAGAGLTEDLSYNPGGGNWNLTFVVGQPASDTYLTNVGSGTLDFAGDDVAYVDVTPEGLLTGEGFAIAWRGAGGAFGQSASVVIEGQPANSGLSTLATIGDDYTSLFDFFWIPDWDPTPGQPNDGDSNGVWINNLRAGIPSSNPLIRTSAKSLDFGEELDNVFPLPTRQFEIRNSALATNTLVISALTVLPNDNNFRVVPPTPARPINIAPGASATVTVEFDPLGTPGDFEATLLIAHNDSNGDKGDLEVALKGRALSSAPPAAFSGPLPAVYEQNFDTLPNQPQADEGGFAIPYPWTDNLTLPSWYASRSNNPPVPGIIASSGEANAGEEGMSGGIYSFGSDGVAERALGSVGSGGAGTSVYGVRVRNDTGEPITGLRVEYVGEQWRKAPNAAAHTLQFSYSISSEPFGFAPVSDDGFVAVPILDFVTPQADGLSATLDGNAPANRVEIDGTITGLSIQPGDEVFFRWKDIDNTGVDHPLAIDDLRLTALEPTVPTILLTGELVNFQTELNAPSAAQSYTVAGENLTGNVAIAPSTGFQISLSSGGPWTGSPNSITLNQSGGAVAPTTVYVRTLSAVSGTVNGTITHTSTGAGQQVLPVSATVFGFFVMTALEVAKTENFDTLGSVGQAQLPDGFALVGGSLNPADFVFRTGASAGNTGTGTLTGTSSGNSYNFGDGVNAEATDRAVGFLTSGGYSSPRNIILTIENQTGALLTEMNVAFDVEKYRSGSREFDFKFYHSPNRSDWTQVPGASVNLPSDGANNIIYFPALSFGQSTTISGLSVAPGARFYLRWEHVGLGGSTNGQALALDNLSIIASGTPVEPGELGDINGDGVINVADVTELANLLAASTPPPTAVGDVNGDGFVTAADVAALAEQIVDGLPQD